MKQKQIEEFLASFGLTENETILYLTLLKSGPSSIMDLSRETGIKRSTAHNNVEDLIKKGLAIQTVHKERRRVMAEDPEKLHMLMEQKKWELSSLEKNLPGVVNLINADFPQKKESQELEIKYYEGLSGVRSIYYLVLHSRELRSYVNISQIFNTFPENTNLFPEAAGKGNLKTWKEIIEDSITSRKYAEEVGHDIYEYRFLPKKWNLKFFDYMIFDENIAIITDKPSVTGILIKNKSIYENAKTLFDMMWELLPSPN